MDDHETTERQARNEAQARLLKRYQRPTLIAYGSLAKLTQSGQGSKTDGVNTMFMVPLVG